MSIHRFHGDDHQTREHRVQPRSRPAAALARTPSAPDGSRLGILKDLRAQFTHITGTEEPFAWQEDLFCLLLNGTPPECVDLPTGTGKTSVMSIWLLALAAQARRGGTISLPRRLVWVVDRRVVVDQATHEADRLADRIEKEPGLAGVREALAKLCHGIAPDDSPLAVSTLRGEREDNREWSENPTRPAIVVGTVDMIGSRLLFSGYGDSRRRRALHAGLLGQDTLLVNDEAHLTCAFAALLRRLSAQTGVNRPMRAMLLSATQRDNSGAFPTSLDADLASEESEFAKRYRAVKRLQVLPPSGKPKEEIRRLALKPDRRTIVFVRSPEEAREIATAIKNKYKGAHVPLITGMQRGHERDQLLGDEIVRRFLTNAPPPNDAEPCWLVATSAGEVGINLSADRLITDLDTVDHLLQRFGRLNRFGETEGDAYVIHSPKQVEGKEGDAPRLKAALDYLHGLPNVSPEALRDSPPPAEAMSEAPHLAPLLPWQIDVWSMTSINASDWPSRPAVEHWLRGDQEGSPPETCVAWREDVDDLASDRVSQTDREEVFECYRVLAKERLKQYTAALRERLEESSYLGRRAILIAADGEIHAGTLAELLQIRGLSYGTLVLPRGVGYLDRSGMVDWSKSTAELSPEELSNYDVSAMRDERTRVRLSPGEAAPETGLRWRCTVNVSAEDENQEGPRWVYFAGKPAQKAPKGAPVALVNHQNCVASLAADLAGRLGFDERAARVFEWAGQWHDAGKARDVWQRAAGNISGPPLAKSLRLNVRMLGGYRHELGSLLDAESKLPSDFSEGERDLALHLVAAHHGWARPHFIARTFDKTGYRRSERAALDCARRFDRLQRRHGAWGLAYLEAIFRCADAIASANSPELPANA